MNRLELRTAIRETLREPTAARWSDTTLNRYINNALEELSRALMRTKTGDVSVAAEAETVTPPTDCLIVNTLYWDDTTEIVRQFDDRIPMDYEDDETTGIPGKYWLIDGLVYLRPIPKEAGTAKFEYYYRLPKLDSDDDSPEITGIDEYIIAHAIFKAYFDDGDPRYELWKQRRSEELISFLGVETSTYTTGFAQNPNW